ncbi:M10 family metallopeptidase C-terminal domain-containing protein, partial [Klebsiella pneumoniae]|uniref:M10 family metallopeptidase C-terminal domain-containing protein n=1 Tax=Klebsiella pneumoniae TaxID=573 RepID=UPI0038526F4A
NDVLTGSDHADALFGLAGNDTLIGGAGADVFYGGSGDDTMTGGGGPDRFVLDQQQSGNDVVTDFKLGQDRIDVSGDNVVSLVDLASHVTQFG